MKRLNKDALLVYARIYTHQRFYFVGEHQGYYRDAHKGDDLKPIPPREWQALCDVINAGYSALKSNICRIVEGKSYMQAMAEKSKNNALTPVPFTQKELQLLQSMSKGCYYIAFKNDQNAGRFYKPGHSHSPFIEMSKQEKSTLLRLIDRGTVWLGDASEYGNTSIIRLVYVRGK